MKKEFFDEFLESVEQMNQIARVETVSSHLGTTKELHQEQLVRAVGLKRLIKQVEVMVATSGNDAPFDANEWLGEWLERPIPALGGAKPSEYMETLEGQEILSTLLAQSQSGVYV